MNDANRAITIANDESLSKFIRLARERLVALAPAFSLPVAQAIAERLAVLGPEAVVTILDVDPEVYRMGYGDLAALEVLEKATADAGTTLNRQDGIRIGLIIVDDKTIVYSPTPRLIEAGPKKPDTPNAIVLGTPPEQVQEELGQGPNGTRDQLVGLDKAERAKIADVKENLARNPPQRFDIARTVRVFNTYFQFVELRLKHTELDKVRVNLPKDISKLTGDTQLDEIMKHSVGLIRDDPSISGNSLKWLRKRIEERYLINLPNYGTVVLRTLKADFEKQVERLRRCVELFCERVEKRIDDATVATRNRLVDRILPHLAKSPPLEWHKHIGSNPSENDIRGMLESKIQDEFDKKLTRVQHMNVTCLFKDVTLEMLKDSGFIALARKRLPGLQDLYLEYDAARTKQEEEQPTLFAD